MNVYVCRCMCMHFFMCAYNIYRICIYNIYRYRNGSNPLCKGPSGSFHVAASIFFGSTLGSKFCEMVGRGLGAGLLWKIGSGMI